ncbi:hypothetical protein BKA70DRAFT_1432982 [Coprinopsis sp. MPI-PUGE-AT-0042]|nr:hypothetical protein BKA70DRAFT_1432982 [Coprinopsis sp. MPI-PUGE-AT-0042]
MYALGDLFPPLPRSLHAFRNRNTSTASGPIFPPELLSIIISFADPSWDFFPFGNLRLVSRSFDAFARPLAFRTLLFIQSSPFDRISARVESLLDLFAERPDTIHFVECIFFEAFDPRTEWHGWLTTPCLTRLMEKLETGRRFRKASFRRASSSPMGGTIATMASALLHPVAPTISSLSLAGAYNLPSNFFEQFVNLISVSLSGCRILEGFHSDPLVRPPNFQPRLRRFTARGRSPFVRPERQPPLPDRPIIPQFDFSSLESLTCSEQLREILAPLLPQGFPMLHSLEIYAEGMYRFRNSPHFAPIHFPALERFKINVSNFNSPDVKNVDPLKFVDNLFSLVDAPSLHVVTLGVLVPEWTKYEIMALPSWKEIDTVLSRMFTIDRPPPPICPLSGQSSLTTEPHWKKTSTIFITVALEVVLQTKS